MEFTDLQMTLTVVVVLTAAAVSSGSITLENSASPNSCNASSLSKLPLCLHSDPRKFSSLHRSITLR